ncbi:MAG TPA: arsenate reductase ArsC [Methylomirabilota bacterium]|nr:arsenate reductase ArsC [Methylomirabilota bacterium]
MLFLCTGNSARSQIAEALLNRKGGGRFVAESAGSQPAARASPHALAALEASGLAWGGRPPRAIDAVADEPWDMVITVCDRAKESCPILPGQPVVAHWGMADPAEVQGDEATVRRAFEETLALLGRRIDLLVALPVDQLDRVALQQRISAIGAP